LAIIEMNESMAKHNNEAKHDSQPPTTIVVVDDDAAVRNSLKFSLELEGFTVRLYADGRELLEDPELPAYGCLIVDQIMPELTGLDVVAALRKRGILSPAVLITPNATPQLRQRAAAAGVAVIEKPFFGNTLVDAIRLSLAA
jgi:two-component system response regulator FixJ